MVVKWDAFFERKWPTVVPECRVYFTVLPLGTSRRAGALKINLAKPGFK
jgi:hypothetical protein